MWDDYGKPRPGRMPIQVYENGQITFAQNTVQFDAPIGTIVGTISVINATLPYKLSVGSNPYYAISGNNLITKAALVGGVDFVQILAVKGFKRISQAIRIVVSGNAAPIPPPPAPPSTFTVGMSLVDITSGGVTTNAELDYAKFKGSTFVRLVFRWEQIQPTLLGPLDPTVLGFLTNVVVHCQAIGLKCWLDCHSFGRYFIGATALVLGGGTLPGDSGVLTTAQFNDLWIRLATVFVAYTDTVKYDIMNEPHDMVGDGPTWTVYAESCRAAIRTVDTTTMILIEGYHFSNTYDWPGFNPDIHTITDAPYNRVRFSGHMYPDPDDSGGSSGFDWDTCVAIGDLLDPGAPLDVHTGVKRLIPFVQWAQLHGKSIDIGESGIAATFGVPDNINWFIQAKNTIDYCQANGIEFCVWAGGQFWGAYAYSLQPGPWISSTSVADSEQWALLSQYTGAAQPTVYFLTGPSNGTVSTPSSNFTVPYRGMLTAPVTVTPNSNGAGGTFTPSSVTLAANTYNPVATFTYTPPAGALTTRIDVTNNGSLTNPAGIVFSTEVDLFSGIAIPQNIISDIQLYASYLGPCRQMRRNSDGAILDFGFAGQGVGVANLGRTLDTAAIATWAPGGATTVKRYSQEPVGNHMQPVFNGDTTPSSTADYPSFSIDSDGFPTDTFSGKRMDMASFCDGLTGRTIISNFNWTSGNSLLNWDFLSQIEFGPGSILKSGGYATVNIGSLDGGNNITLSPPGNVMEVYGATATINTNTPLSAAGMAAGGYVTGTLANGPGGFARYTINQTLSLNLPIVTIYGTAVGLGVPDHTNYENGQMALGAIPGEYHIHAETWQANTTDGWRTWRDGTLFAKNKTYTTSLSSDFNRGIAHIGYNIFAGPTVNAKLRDVIVWNVAIPDANNVAIQNYLKSHYATLANGGLPQAPVAWDIVLDFLNNAYTVDGASVTMASQSNGTRDAQGLICSSTSNLIGATLTALAGTAWTMEVEFANGPTTDDGGTHGLIALRSGTPGVNINYSQSGLYIVGTTGGASGGSLSAGINNSDFSTPHRCAISSDSAGWLMAQNAETYASTATAMTTGWTSVVVAYFNTMAGLRIRHIKIKRAKVTLAQLMTETSAIGTAGAAGPVWLPGVNLSGGSYQPTPFWENNAGIDYHHDRGSKLLRQDFLWEHIQPSLGGALDAPTLANLDAIITRATGYGMTVILDCHNFGKYGGIAFGAGGGPTSANLADLWSRLATRYAANPLVAYGLMNEPGGTLSQAAWYTICDASRAAIRTAGATGLVLIPVYNNSSQATTMIKSGAAAAIVAAGITDSNWGVEVHQYYDSGGNETSPNIAFRYVGTTVLQAATAWARSNGIRLFFGEQGTDWNVNNPLAQTELSESYQFIAANKDVWIGFSYFCGGPAVGDTFFNIEPAGPTTNTAFWAVTPYGERSIMGVLRAAE